MEEQLKKDLAYMEGFEHRTLASLHEEAEFLVDATSKRLVLSRDMSKVEIAAYRRLQAMLNMVNGAIEERTLWPYKVRYVAFGHSYSLRCGNFRAAMRKAQELEDDPNALWPSVMVCCTTHGWQYCTTRMGSPVHGGCRVCGYVPD